MSKPAIILACGCLCVMPLACSSKIRDVTKGEPVTDVSVTIFDEPLGQSNSEEVVAAAEAFRRSFRLGRQRLGSYAQPVHSVTLNLRGGAPVELGVCMVGEYEGKPNQTVLVYVGSTTGQARTDLWEGLVKSMGATDTESLYSSDSYSHE